MSPLEFINGLRGNGIAAKTAPWHSDAGIGSPSHESPGEMWNCSGVGTGVGGIGAGVGSTVGVLVVGECVGAGVVGSTVGEFVGCGVGGNMRKPGV